MSNPGSGDKGTGKLDLGILEEDDDFEEFPADSHLRKKGEEENAKVWDDNWDDDNIEDDFSLQLKAELEKVKKEKGAAPAKK